MACGINVNILRLTRWPHEVAKMLDGEDGDLREHLRVHWYTCVFRDHHHGAARTYACPENFHYVWKVGASMDCLKSWHIVACDCHKEKLASVINGLPRKLRVELHDAMPGLLAAAYGRARASRAGCTRPPSGVGNCLNP